MDYLFTLVKREKKNFRVAANVTDLAGSLVRAKFHYTDPTGPARTQRSFAAKKSVRVRAGPVGSVSGPCSGI